VDRTTQAAALADRRERTVLTIVNSLSPTSMPLNEFVAWRALHHPEERHLVLALRAGLSGAAPGFPPARVSIRTAGGKASFVRAARRILRELERDREPALVHIHHPRSGALFQIARSTTSARCPVLFTVHNMFSRYGAVTRALSVLNFVRADHVTFVSSAAADAFPSRLRRWRADANSVIPNGVDLDRVDAVIPHASAGTARSSSSGRRFRLVNVGKFTAQKGHAFLLEVVQRAPDVDLVLVGDGPLRPEVEIRVERMGMADRVRFTGLVSRERVYEELLAADLFVSPALWEGLPIAVLEAMALSTPVLLSDIPPHQEIRREYPDLQLLPADPAEWAEWIREWGRTDPAERVRMGLACRAAVERSFSLAAMHGSYTGVYDALANGGSAPL